MHAAFNGRGLMAAEIMWLYEYGVFMAILCVAL